jgi:integrase
MPLTDAKIRTAPAKARRYRLTDSHGLSVEIAPKGKRSGPKDKPRKFWRYRYELDGKENLFAAGEWCTPPNGERPAQAEARRVSGRMTLAEARTARVTWRDQVRAGQHPRLVRQTERLLASQTRANTFKALALEFVEKRGGGWSAGYRLRFDRFMERDAFPYIGALPIASVIAPHVLEILQRVEERGAPSTAVLGRGLIGQVFNYAIAAGKVTANPVPALRDALVKTEKQHYPTLARSEIGPFLKAIANARASRITEIAIGLLMLSMTRTIETRLAMWPEFDLTQLEWRIPAAKMKMRRPHIVPLSRQAAALVQELQPLTGRGQYLFPNIRRPLEAMGRTTIGRVFERAGYLKQFSPHGFRGTASTLLRGAGFDDRLIELQLAHLDRNKSRAAYDHAELLGPRREMLEQWADLIDRLAIPAAS